MNTSEATNANSGKRLQTILDKDSQLMQILGEHL